MEIIKAYPENLIENKRAMYALTRAQSTMAKDLPDGETINPAMWLLYKDVNNSGEEHEVLAMQDPDKGIVSTISGPFIAEFEFIHDMMGADDYEIKLRHGKTTKGRDFITCELI